MTDSLDKLLDWIDIPSISGAETDYAEAVSDDLQQRGFSVERQDVDGGRFNIVARAGTPDLVFCTHLDTVPPWIGPRKDSKYIHGRGACDAKGVALAMIEAGSALVEAGEDRIGFLFTVGEEVDFCGARHANEHQPDGFVPRFTIVGEPTDNRFVRAHKGVLALTLRARGVASHSSRPEGPSAIHELISCAGRFLAAPMGSHPVLGEGSLNVGCIRGGHAPNVVAPEAEADVLVRIVEPVSELRSRLGGLLGDNVEMEEGAVCEPMEFLVPEGEEGTVEAFGTDAPLLSRFGSRLLYGPGSILDAHTEHERMSRESFRGAVLEYQRIARSLLSG